MTRSNLHHGSELEIHTCPTCFVLYAIPVAMSERKLELGEQWYCPNGHVVVFRKNRLAVAQAEADALRIERDRAVQQKVMWQERAETVQRSATALKGQLTKTRKRIGAGVCPCCNRQFTDLQRHMTGKHAGYVAEQGAAA